MKINENAPVKQAKEISINARPEQVWAVLTDVNRWTEWNKKITKASMQNVAKTGTPFSWTVNGAKIKSVLHTVSKNHAFGWSGTTFGGSAIHNWYLQSNGNETVVKVEESMEGWLVWLFKSKMNSDLGNDMQYWLDMLKSESEK
jgi:uncharacterized protein YndB with AHSA1/START domain